MSHQNRKITTVCRCFLFLVLHLMVLNAAQAQSTLAKLKYEDAEAAFLKSDYATVISKLEEAEKLLGATNPKILFLQIVARDKQIINNPHGDYEQLQALRKRCNYYLKNYGDLDNISDKYREVYTIAERLKNYSDNLNFFKGRAYMFGTGVQKDYAKAKALLEKAIREGDSHALNAMGLLYKNGWGVARDHKAAMEWFHKGANKGNHFALFNIGEYYYYGDAGERDNLKAHDWYVKAASKGNPGAMYRLGNLYRFGWGVSKDYAKAFDWFSKAAEAGHEYAEVSVGQFYYFGYSVAKDYAQAYQWFQKAADKDISDGLLWMGHMYRYGNHVQKDYDKAIAWYEKAAAKGNGDAMENLGEVHYYAFTGKQDYNKALAWYKKAAENGGSDKCAVQVANIYKQAGNVSEARGWLTLGAEKGNAKAMVELGKIYVGGMLTGSKPDPQTAYQWFKKAAEKGDPDGMCEMAELLRKKKVGLPDASGKLSTKDNYTVAMQWFLKAAEGGSRWALYQISEMYRWGEGVRKSKAMAQVWNDKYEAAKAK